MSGVSTSATQHGQWRSAFTFIMATTGAAVGLGNIWKFPYMVGDNGGSAFVLVYLVFVILIGLPTMIAEVMIGKLGRKNPVDSLKELAIKAKHTPLWSTFGWLGALALLCVLSFYSVVAGWSLAYFVMALKGTFNHVSPTQVTFIWDELMASPSRLLLWHSIFMLMTLVVVARGIEKGIELASNILMPMLFILLLVLVGYACIVGDFGAAFKFLFSFDLSQINRSVLLSAMGHAFFTLALGGGALLVYGAYLPPKTSLSKTLAIVAVLDTLVALLAGLAIFPIVFAYQLPVAEGVGLMYKILPISFSGLPFGQLIAASFFLLLVFAAWTSTFSLAEPLAMLIVEKTRLSRSKATIVVGTLAWALGIGALLSFNIGANFHPIGQWDVFTLLTLLPLNILLPLGGLAFAVFAGWVIDKKVTQEALGANNKLTHKLWLITVRWVAPIGILAIFISSFV